MLKTSTKSKTILIRGVYCFLLSNTIQNKYPMKKLLNYETYQRNNKPSNKTNFDYFSSADCQAEFFKIAASQNQKLHFAEKSGF